MDTLAKKIQQSLKKYFGKKIPENLSINKVLRLDSNQHYFLVSFDSTSKKTTLAIINEGNLEVSQSAEVDKPFTITKPQAVQDIEKSGGITQLAWKPCQLSFSPFYPFWKVEFNKKVFYVDKTNKVYDTKLAPKKFN